MEQLNHTQSHNAVDVQQDSSDIEKTEKIFAAMRILDDELDIKTANEMV